MTIPAPSDDDPLIDLLLEWEERVARGEVVSAADLCKDRPELVPALSERIARLKRVAPFAEPEPLDQVTGAWRPPAEPLCGRYRLDQVIGEGGYGVVWRGYDLELKRPIAVKLPRPGRLPRGPGMKDAFRAEAERVAGLSHPGIVQVFDMGQYRGRTFIVSALIDGEDLARRIRSGPVPVRVALRIVAEAAAHLHYAHEQGFVHRDIKPANILVGTDGRVFVTDFGVAASVEDLQTGAADVAGTRDYMAPEQLAPGPGGVDRRADVFALGVVLFELLTNVRPFERGTEVRAQLVPPSARRQNKAVPVELDQICGRCLEDKPGDRYQTANDLANELWEWLQRPPARLLPEGLVNGLKYFLGLCLLHVLFGGGRGSSIPIKFQQPALNPHVSVESTSDRANAVASYARAVNWSDKKQYDKAIKDFDETIRLDPGNADALIGRGRAWWFKKEYDKAVEDLDGAIRVRPDSPGAMILCFFAARRARNVQAAERALGTFSFRWRAWPHPVVQFLRGQIDEAQLLVLAHDDYDRTEAHCYLGLDKVIKGDKKEAMVHFWSVIEQGKSMGFEHALALDELERLERDEK